jgi:hypothetical protein
MPQLLVQGEGVVFWHPTGLQVGSQIANQGVLTVFAWHDQGLHCGVQAQFMQAQVKFGSQQMGICGLWAGELNAAFKRLKGHPGGRTIHGLNFAYEFQGFC